MPITSQQLSDLSSFRHELHQHPELSGQEYKTAETILQKLKTLEPDQIWTNIGQTGIVALFDSNRPGPRLLFRAELDALPIQEVNNFAHRSNINGVSHKCGHDGHSTILIGLAQQLADQRPKNGSVLLLFQPAEETGAGAKAMLEDKTWTTIPKPDYVFALHNLPGWPLGQIVLKNGAISASVRSMIIQLQGKTAHAAEPENGENPALPMAKMLQAFDQLSNNDLHRSDFCVITPVYLQLGEKAYGVAAGYGEVHLTIRTWTETQMQSLIEQMTQIIETALLGFQIEYQISWTDSFVGNHNHPKATDLVRLAARKLNYQLEEKVHPLKWGEDFGYFTQQFPGAFLGLGAGETCPALHNPDYDFPDELLDYGVSLFMEIIYQANPSL